MSQLPVPLTSHPLPPDRDALSVRLIATPLPAKRRKEEETGTLWRPVVDKRGVIVGLRQETTWLADETPQLAWETVLSLPETATIAEARRLFAECDQPLIPLVDKKGRYTGECADRRLLHDLLTGCLRPARVGGMATPLGVYMTTGKYIGGSGIKGLIATGICFAVLATALDWSYIVVWSAMVALFEGVKQWDAFTQLWVQFSYLMIMTLMLIRMTPIAGLHAAEHMTISAMEAGLPLSRERVRPMPRVHPRCGTNLMVVLLVIQLVVLASSTLFPKLSWVGQALYLVFWAFVIDRSWRQAGRFVQQHFTTRPPSDAELDSGLKAGQELLAKFAAQPHPPMPLWRRLLATGMIPLLISFSATAYLLDQALRLLGGNP